MDSKIKYGLGGAAGLYLGVYLLFAGKFFLEGYGITPPWIYWFDGVLGWWILFWSILIFGCCYALRKEFLTLKSGLAVEYPDLSVEFLNKASRHLFAMKYGRISLSFFCILPVAYLCTQIDGSLTSLNWITALILSLPAIATAAWLIISEKKDNTIAVERKDNTLIEKFTLNKKRIILSATAVVTMVLLLLLLPTPYSQTSLMVLGAVSIVSLIGIFRLKPNKG